MDGKQATAGGRDFFHEIKQGLARRQVVNRDTAFHRDRYLHGVLHCGDTFGDKIGLRHQACAERAGLHPV